MYTGICLRFTCSLLVLHGYVFGNVFFSKQFCGFHKGRNYCEILGMSGLDFESLKLIAEIEKHEKTLCDLSKKWEEDSALKRLSKQDQATVVRAVVSAKRLATLLIPKLKFKVNLSQKTPSDRRHKENAADEWNAMKPKIESTLRDFKMLETGNRPGYPTKEQKQRDEVMSKNIETLLKSKMPTGKGKSAQVDASSSFPGDGRGDMGRNMSDASGSVPQTRNLGTGDGSEPSTSTLNNGAGYGKKLLHNVRHFRDQLSTGRKNKGTLSEIVEDVCPDDAASVKQYIRSLAASETTGTNDFLSQEMLDEIRGFDAEEVDRRKAERNKRLAKSNEIREQRIQKIEKLAQVEPILTRPSLPSSLPIDGFLDLVETLPGEIQKLVTTETEALSDYYKNQFFLRKEPLSNRQGTLVNMNNLKKEHRDQRFDASDFHIRAPESAIAEEHLKKLKDHRVDNAVGRFFGTFSAHLDFDAEESESPNSPDDDMKLSFDNFE